MGIFTFDGVTHGPRLACGAYLVVGPVTRFPHEPSPGSSPGNWSTNGRVRTRQPVRSTIYGHAYHQLVLGNPSVSPVVGHPVLRYNKQQWIRANYFKDAHTVYMYNIRITLGRASNG